MAPKTHYDAGEVQQEVNEAAAKEFENLKAEGWEFSESTELTCEYLGAATEDGYTLAKKPTLRSTIGLKWSYRDHCTVASLIKNVRYDYYLGHGISFPEHWKTAFKCDFLTRIAQDAAVTFAQEALFEDVALLSPQKLTRTAASPKAQSLRSRGQLEFQSNTCCARTFAIRSGSVIGDLSGTTPYVPIPSTQATWSPRI